MQRIATNYLGVLQGHAALFDRFVADTDMWSGTGDREINAEIRFAKPFLAAPTVFLTIAMIDKESPTPLRLVLEPKAIRQDGFIAQARSWGDTQIARLSVNWTALGAIADPDEAWDV